MNSFPALDLLNLHSKDSHATVYHCKNIWVISTIFQLSQLHVYGVHIMKFKECFQTGLLKTLK